MGIRNTVRYTMRNRNRIVKFGVTGDPKRRESENIANGLGTSMRIEGPRVTEKTAGDWERRKIDAYAARNGRKPPGNKV